MIDLPSGWIPATLGAVCSKPQYGWTCKAAKSGRVKFLRTTDISGGTLDWETVPYCNEEPPALSKYRLRRGDILISRAGSVGISFLMREVPQEAVFASYLIRFNPHEGVLPEYLAYFLKTSDYWSAISEHSAGIAVPNVNASKLAEIELPIAPLQEQRRIVAKLEEVLGKVDACQKRLERIPLILKRFRQSVLAAACSGRLTEEWRKDRKESLPPHKVVEQLKARRLRAAKTPTETQRLQAVYTHEEQSGDELPDSWAHVALRKLCSSFDYGSAKKSQPSGKVPVLRMGNIQDGRLDWSDLVYSSDKEEIAKYALKPRTVLFNRTNSPELVGKTAIYNGERPAIFAGYLIRVNVEDVLDPDYLHLCLNTPHAKQFCSEVKTDGVSQSNINAQSLGRFEVPFCSIEEQCEIVRRVESLFKLADQIEFRYKAAKASVDQLTQSILAKAFRGELVPQDPQDEPAGRLLERIRRGDASLGNANLGKRKGTLVQ